MYHSPVNADPARVASHQVRGHLSELKALLADKENFVTALSDGAPYKLPAQIPFTTFQKLEKTSDPEFMEAAIDYAEARARRETAKRPQ